MQFRDLAPSSRPGARNGADDGSNGGQPLLTPAGEAFVRQIRSGALPALGEQPSRHIGLAAVPSRHTESPIGD